MIKSSIVVTTNWVFCKEKRGLFAPFATRYCYGFWAFDSKVQRRLIGFNKKEFRSQESGVQNSGVRIQYEKGLECSVPSPEGTIKKLFW
jgi:hypothetical protein